ncbi:MAG: AAA family ATPase, partial [Sulfurimonas sp.]|nr:AAA family ATPase [Sulfurimonas sp.]
KSAIDYMSTSAEKFIINGYPNIFRDLGQYFLDNKKLLIDNKQNHIIIIDEINRGNISKIFGELITLIEPSKRIGADDEIKLRLPYSNDEFGVPKNLYIIGTMNTADRSIALMDTALRRRFDFVEMMPDYEVLNEKVGLVVGIDIAKLLLKINERIEYLYDRDHTIGHAYFLSLHVESSIDDLNSIFKNKIIPLLQEYFYDDWEKILLVLNDGFIEKNKQNYKSIFNEKIDDDYIEDDKFSYEVRDSFSKESYTKIYE